MEVRQGGFSNNPKPQPNNWQAFIKKAKVIKVNPGKKKVDVVMMDGSGGYSDVPVLCDMISTASGVSYLPTMHLPSNNKDAPKGYGKRDIFAIIAFLNGIGTMPIIIGFQHPEYNQLSFDNKTGYENHFLFRHEGDQYTRLIGDTVSEIGGSDKPSEAEIRYPDNSYLKVYKRSGTKKLTNLSGQNVDNTSQPFRLKQDDSKGFYFQHSSGTRILIDPDGQIKVSHHTGTWFSISPSEADIAAETVDLSVIESSTDPPAAPVGDPVKIHLEHSSGTKFTIDTDGKIYFNGVDGLDATFVGPINLTSDDSINLEAPSVNLTSTVATTLTSLKNNLVGNTEIENIDFNTHVHTNVETGTDNSGGPVNGV